MFSNLRTSRLFRKGVRHIEAAEYEQALSCFTEVVARNSGDAPAHNNIGFCQFRLGRYDEAVAGYRRARELEPADPHYACDLASVYLKMGRVEEARRAFDDALTLDTGCIPALVGMGECMNLRGAHAEAADMFWRLIRIDPKSVEGHCGLGMAYLGLSRYDQARAALVEALQLKPDHAASHESLARVYEATDRPREALLELEEAARCQPFSARAQCAVGDAGIRLGQWQRAFNAYQRALRLQPDLSAAKAGLTIAHQQLQDDERRGSAAEEESAEASSSTREYASRAVARGVGGRFAQDDLPVFSDDLFPSPTYATSDSSDSAVAGEDVPDMADLLDDPGTDASDAHVDAPAPAVTEAAQQDELPFDPVGASDVPDARAESRAFEVEVTDALPYEGPFAGAADAGVHPSTGLLTEDAHGGVDVPVFDVEAPPADAADESRDEAMEIALTDQGWQDEAPPTMPEETWEAREAPGPPAPPPPDEDAARLSETGEDHFIAGRYQEALAAWDRAARIDERDPVLHNNRAAALLELGEHRLAMEACRRALQLDPRYAVGRATLCEVLLRAGDRAGAQRELPSLRMLDANLAAEVERMLDS